MSKSDKEKELSGNERYVVKSILHEVISCMKWESDMQEYQDGGGFILSLSKEDMRSLKAALKKI